jgi:hypothetical protein
MDADAAHWARDLAGYKAQVGACAMTEAPQPKSAMAANFNWTCEHGRVSGSLLLAPTRDVALQSLSFEVLTP